MATDLQNEQVTLPDGNGIVLRMPESGVSYSNEAFWKLCLLNPDKDFERNADGSVVVMTPAGGGSSRRTGHVYGQLYNWSMAGGGGEPFESSAGFTLPNGAVRAPDASWVRSERWDALSEDEQEAFPRIVPDFIVEVRSPSDRISDLRKKMREYIEQGVKLGWLIDKQSKMVEIYRPDRPPQRLENVESLSGDPELPGFVLDLKVIWARKSH
jgi:Uma2 family endonuclease